MSDNLQVSVVGSTLESWDNYGVLTYYPPGMDTSTVKWELLKVAMDRCVLFCKLNEVPAPKIHVQDKRVWSVSKCAYYRWQKIYEGDGIYGDGPRIHICLDQCASPCGETRSRLWDWPGYCVDRTPYGVVAHELGHHFDVHEGKRLGLAVSSYMSEYSFDLEANRGREKCITSYGDDTAHEWFAESFRLFVTNPELLSLVAPRAYELLRKNWEPLGADNEGTIESSAWGRGFLIVGDKLAPDRVFEAARNKIKAHSGR